MSSKPHFLRRGIRKKCLMEIHRCPLFFELLVLWETRKCISLKKKSDHRRGRSKNTGNLTVFYRKFRIFTVLTFLEIKFNARIVFLVRKYVGIVVFKKILRRKILADFWQMAISGKNPKIRILWKKLLSSKCFVLQLFWRIFGRGTRFWHYFWPPEKLKRSKSGITDFSPLISR